MAQRLNPTGTLAEQMSDFERAIKSYESALRHNPYSFSALFKIATLCRGREQYHKVIPILSEAQTFVVRPLNFSNVP